MARMDASGTSLHLTALMNNQDGCTVELRSFDGEKFEKISVFENFRIAILDPLAHPSVEKGQLG